MDITSHLTDEDVLIETMGVPKTETPVRCFANAEEQTPQRICKNYIRDQDRVLIDLSEEHFLECFRRGEVPLSFEKAGPRYKIFYHPKQVKCAIVTAGGLCPGLNDVIRAIVLELYYIYGVHNIIGIPYGYQGFIPAYNHSVIDLNPERVSSIHELGGTILSSSRGQYPIEEIVDSLQQLNVNILFTIGGDGTLRGADLISQEIKRRGLVTSVIGIPKTIDNDISLVEKSFGFATAVESAAGTIRSAHIESLGAPKGIGMVKLMGRNSGFIAAHAALASREANLVLIPETDFDLEGPEGLLAAIQKRLDRPWTCGDRGGRRSRAKIFYRRPLKTGPFGKHPVRRYRAFSGRQNQGPLCPAEAGDQPEIHRSQLHRPQPAGQFQRPDLLRLPGAKRGPCRDGRQDQYGGQSLEQPIRARPHPGRGSPPEAGGLGGQYVAERSGIHRPTPLKE